MTALEVLPASFYRRSAAAVARDLLGRLVSHDVAGERLLLRLVEVEAYLGPDDPACHTFGGRRTARVASMYRGGGHAYVYAIYGRHFCLNVVCGEIDSGAAVLLRAGEVREGGESMARRRGLTRAARAGEIAGGPGRLTAALGVDRTQDGVTLLSGALRLLEGEPVGEADVGVGRRIGVDYAGEAAGWPLRFAVRGSREVSRPRPG